MMGDIADFARRLSSVLPRGWFSDSPPITNMVLSALATAWSSIYALIDTVTDLARISTSTGSFLDLISADFFGTGLMRRIGEADAAFSVRIRRELFRPRGTRLALEQALQDTTGRIPQILEPARPSDTGGYSVGGVSYGQAGAWGNLKLSHCVFVTAYRPQGSGIAHLAGYGTGGPVVYGDLDMVSTIVSDLDIYAAAAAVLPLGATGWLRIE